MNIQIHTKHNTFERIGRIPLIGTAVGLGRIICGVAKTAFYALEASYEKLRYDSWGNGVYRIRREWLQIKLGMTECVPFLPHLTNLKSHLLKNKAKIKNTSAASEEPLLDSSPFKTMSQTTFCTLLEELDQYRRKRNWIKVDFAEWLALRGYSPVLEEINFNEENITTLLSSVETGLAVHRGRLVLKGMLLEGLTFKNCSFEGVNFRKSEILNCRFEHCSLDETVFRSVSFKNCVFEACTGQNCCFDQASLALTAFEDCKLPRANFNWASLEETSFEGTELTGASFIETVLHDTNFLRSHLQDALLPKGKFTCDAASEMTMKRNLPTIGVSWDIDWPLVINVRVAEGLAAHGALPVRLDIEPVGLNVNKLQKEVAALLELAKDPSCDPLNKEVDSLPYRLIRIAQEHAEQYPVTREIIQRAKKTLLSLDALLLPGGWNAVEPEFYGITREEAQAATHRFPLSFDDDYRHIVMECALLYWAIQLGKPVTGICRGSQLTNVFFGGELVSEVDGHFKVIQRLGTRKKSAGQIYGATSGAPFEAFSFHHQANTKIPEEHLSVIIAHKEVPKALEGTSQLPLLLFQFHPEYKAYQPNPEAVALGSELSTVNLKLWEAIIDSARNSKNRGEGFLKDLSQANSPPLIN